MAGINDFTRRGFMASGGALALSACSSRVRRYTGPEVTSLVAHKERRSLYLLHHSEILQAYDFDLGFAPVGHKQFEGDGRTPEGVYFISHRNPNSNYHLSVRISYPNSQDVAFAQSMGRRPGGDIFIHGTPRDQRRERDWTAGCIAVKNKEIEEIYMMVRLGTPIIIHP